MKKGFVFFILAIAVFLGSFYGAKKWEQTQQKKPVQKEAQVRFVPTSFLLKNHPFVIVIIGRNNGAFLCKTLESAFSQCYDLCRIIYIDDASDDGSSDLAKDFIDTHPSAKPVIWVQNEKTLGFLANLARAVQLCEKEEI